MLAAVTNLEAVILDLFTFGPAAISAGTSIASFARALRRDRRAEAEAASEATEGVFASQFAFQQATVVVLHRLSYLSDLGMPPPVRGALWSWPAAYRVSRDFHHVVEALHVSLVPALTLSPEDIAQPTIEAFEVVGHVCAGFATQGRPGKSEFNRRLDEAYDRLGTHGAALRLLVVD